MLASAAALGALDVAGLVTPAVLLILLCGVGVGQGLTGPIAQTLQPELVPAPERPQAIALGSVNQNLARAIGPAIGGLLLAATSAALLFFVNAASFLAVIVVVATVSVPARVLALPREHVRSATRAGGRFVRNSPALLAIMVRAAAFGFFASGVWALLPLVARHTLGLGSGGYGLLLGARRDRRAARRNVLAGDPPRALPARADGGLCRRDRGLRARARRLARRRDRRRAARAVRHRLDPRARPAQRVVPVDAAELGQGPGDGLLHGRVPGRHRDRRAHARRDRPGDFARRRL